MRLCSVDGCDVQHWARGWCKKHYDNWRRRGSATAPGRNDPAEIRYERFIVKDPDAGCWVWQGTVSPRGYGYISDKLKERQAHRFVYELLRGPIPAGLVLDHLCRNTRCVNPEHLEPVTSRENTVGRGMGPLLVGHRLRVCQRGHSVEGDNLYVPPGHPGQRRCVECGRIALRASRARRRAA